MSLQSTNGLLLLSTAMLCMAFTPSYINAQTIKPVSPNVESTVPNKIKISTNRNSSESLKLSPEEVEDRLSQASEETVTIISPILTSTYEEDCSPEHQEFNADIMIHGRIATASNAFEQCVRNDVESNYQQCNGDPFFNSPIDKQIEKVIAISRSTNNTNISCKGANEGALASAGLGSYEHKNDENFKWGSWFSNAYDRLGFEVCEADEKPETHDCRRNDPWPYSKGAGIIWHEVLHTHGYTHGANDQGPAKTACGYQNSSSWNFQRNTMPYIVGDCVSEVIKQSANVCGAIDTCPLPNQLKIVNNINGNSCECLSDPARIGSVSLTSKIGISGGLYTIKQKSSGRFIDAFQSADEDYNNVTRKAQSNNTQKWKLTTLGTVYELRQKSNKMYLTASQLPNRDYSAWTSIREISDAEKWVILPSKNDSFTIQQLSSARFLDAYEGIKDHSVVTRTIQNDPTQQWTLSFIENDIYQTYKIQQKSSGRFLDAYESSDDGNYVVTRESQNNDTQNWFLVPLGSVFSIEQKSSRRLLDAYGTEDEDFSVVTRAAQNNDTQRWVVLASGAGTHTIQQLSSGKFVDAYESNNDGKDFSVVTRKEQINDTQQWVFTRTEN